jgi:hypothetical protein
MHRYIVLLFFPLIVAVVVNAAPAPIPKPWINFWDTPIDKRGKCRFDRRGERLTIIVPGKGHDFDVGASRLNAPRLLRGVNGDFVAQVRVGGDFGPPDVADYRPPFPVRRAGLLVAGEKLFVRFLRAIDLDSKRQALIINIAGSHRGKRHEREWVVAGPSPDGPVFLRVERRGGSIEMTHTDDGKRWSRTLGPLAVGLTGNLKVGVIAEATASGTFEPVFDHFDLTKPAK